MSKNNYDAKGKNSHFLKIRSKELPEGANLVEIDFFLFQKAISMKQNVRWRTDIHLQKNSYDRNVKIIPNFVDTKEAQPQALYKIIKDEEEFDDVFGVNERKVVVEVYDYENTVKALSLHEKRVKECMNSANTTKRYMVANEYKDVELMKNLLSGYGFEAFDDEQINGFNAS